jgi:hypothetical protein
MIYRTEHDREHRVFQPSCRRCLGRAARAIGAGFALLAIWAIGVALLGWELGLWTP